MQTLTIKRENGNVTKALTGQDHVSGILVLVSADTDIPDAFKESPYVACSSTKAAEALGLTASASGAAAALYAFVYDALRLNPGISLWLGCAVASEDYAPVAALQNAASGNIRQMAVYDLTLSTPTKAAVTALQAQASAMDAAWMPLSLILSAPFASTPAELASIKLAASAPNVSILVGKDTESTYPALGALIGVLSARAVNESIAWVQECETGLTAPAFTDGTPYADVDSATLEAIDNARFIYLRTYPGLSGVYFSDSHNMDAASSDYAQIELQRTMDKAVRGTRTYLLPELGRPIYFNSDGTLRADTLQHLRTVAGKAVEDMEKAGEVSGWAVDIDATQDVLSTSTVEFTIHAVPVGIMRKAVVSIGYVKSL